MEHPTHVPSKPVLTIVEELPGQLIYDPATIYTTEFWRPFIPLHLLRFEKTGDREFVFKIDEQVKLDPAGLLTTRYQASGTIEVQDHGDQGSKGYFWELYINVHSPAAKVFTRVRARELPPKQGEQVLKIGIFIQSLDFDAGLLDTIPGGRDAILFAIRVYIRQFLQNIALSK